MEFLIIAVIIIFIMQYSNHIDTGKFINDVEPYFRGLMEDDYEFLLRIKYGKDIDVNKLYSNRVRNGLLTIIVLIFAFAMYKFSFINVLLAVIIGFLVFKSPYTSLQAYYKKNLHNIDRMLPYYLKSLEILIQHYTVPVALRRSIKSAPEIFVPGLEKLVAKIEEGDSSVDPYMDFAKEYPVRDSMRMMRLLYRLGLGEQEKKHQQLVSFSRSVSSLQAKAREMKYKARLDTMEKKTLVMMVVTGAGSLILLLISIFMLITSV